MRGCRIQGILLTGLLAAVALGCGGGDDSPATAAHPNDSPTPEKKLYLKQINAICSQGSADLSKAAYEALPHGGPPPTNSELIKFAKESAIPILQIELNSVKRLPPPAGDEATVRAMVRKAQSNIDALRAAPFAFSVRRQFSVFDKTNEAAKRYGLVPCGSVR
jgi:hypothetical protein